MPYVAVHIAQGRPLEKRRRLIAAITDAVADILEIERRETWVVIHEHDRDNWGIGGELLSERLPAKPPDVPDLDSLFRQPTEKLPAPKATPKAAAQKPKAKPKSRR
jgi:4-oxalocrotonate tautomerase